MGTKSTTIDGLVSAHLRRKVMATAKALVLGAIAAGTLALIAHFVTSRPPVNSPNPAAVLERNTNTNSSRAERVAWEEWVSKTDAHSYFLNYQLAFTILLDVISANLAVAAVLKLASDRTVIDQTEATSSRR